MRALGASESQMPSPSKPKDIKRVPGWRWHVAFMVLVMGCPPGQGAERGGTPTTGLHPTAKSAVFSPPAHDVRSAVSASFSPLLLDASALTPFDASVAEQSSPVLVARESFTPVKPTTPKDAAAEDVAPDEAGADDFDAPESVSASGSSGARSSGERSAPNEPPSMIDLTAETLPGSPLTQMPVSKDGKSLAMNISAQATFSREPFTGVILKVVDGDTYHLEDGTKIRLSGVNTPEKSEQIGKKVKKEVTAWLLGKAVTVYPITRDHYGRVVGDVRLDGHSVTETLITNGWAHVYLIPPSQPENLALLLQRQRDARDTRKGIWAEERYRGPLHITSFHANARGEDAKNLSGEYVRIANTSDTALNLAGFTLSSMHGQQLVLPDITIPAGYTFQVVSGKGTLSGSTSEPFKIYWSSDGPVWNDDQEQATLRDPSGKWLDAAEHGLARTQKRN